MEIKNGQVIYDGVQRDVFNLTNQLFENYQTDWFTATNKQYFSCGTATPSPAIFLCNARSLSTPGKFDELFLFISTRDIDADIVAVTETSVVNHNFPENSQHYNGNLVSCWYL